MKEMYNHQQQGWQRTLKKKKGRDEWSAFFANWQIAKILFDREMQEENVLTQDHRLCKNWVKIFRFCPS